MVLTVTSLPASVEKNTNSVIQNANYVTTGMWEGLRCAGVLSNTYMTGVMASHPNDCQIIFLDLTTACWFTIIYYKVTT